MKLEIVNEYYIQYKVEYGLKPDEVDYHVKLFRDKATLLEFLENNMSSFIWYDVSKFCSLFIDER